jgi:hypothetical protein
MKGLGFSFMDRNTRHTSLPCTAATSTPGAMASATALAVRWLRSLTPDSEECDGVEGVLLDVRHHVAERPEGHLHYAREGIA